MTASRVKSATGKFATKLNYSNLRIALGLVSGLIFTVWSGHRLSRFEIPTLFDPDSTPTFFHPSLLKSLSFGHPSVLADALWINALQKSNYSHVLPGRRGAAFYPMDLATQIDPAFYMVYIHGPLVLGVARMDTQSAMDLLDRGEHFRVSELSKWPLELQSKSWPENWRIPMAIGFFSLIDLQDVPRAIRGYSAAASFPDVWPIIKETAVKMQTLEGQYEVAINTVRMLENTTEDTELKKALARKRRNLYVSSYVHSIHNRFSDYLQQVPGYRAALAVSVQSLGRHFEQFKKKSRLAPLDPWGGKLYLDAKGKVRTTTPHEQVFGMSY